MTRERGKKGRNPKNGFKELQKYGFLVLMKTSKPFKRKRRI
jgi:hypothetical protein